MKTGITSLDRDKMRQGRFQLMKLIIQTTLNLIFSLVVGFFISSLAFAQINETCTIGILNRTAQVKPDGTWVLPNIPAGFGQVRARATCVEDGVTRSGQSDFFTIAPNRMNAIVPLSLGITDPLPESLTISAPTTTLTSEGAVTQLAVTANFPDGSTADVTQGSVGTNYTISNSVVATVIDHTL
jgi:hypothetical protein